MKLNFSPGVQNPNLSQFIIHLVCNSFLESTSFHQIKFKSQNIPSQVHKQYPSKNVWMLRCCLKLHFPWPSAWPSLLNQLGYVDVYHHCCDRLSFNHLLLVALWSLAVPWTKESRVIFGPNLPLPRQAEVTHRQRVLACQVKTWHILIHKDHDSSSKRGPWRLTFFSGTFSIARHKKNSRSVRRMGRKANRIIFGYHSQPAL